MVLPDIQSLRLSAAFSFYVISANIH
jgi:hypothetical protein